MAGLVPAIHVFKLVGSIKTWMPVTSTGMTKGKLCYAASTSLCATVESALSR
jgi:hypothetical protein